MIENTVKHEDEPGELIGYVVVNHEEGGCLGCADDDCAVLATHEEAEKMRQQANLPDAKVEAAYFWKMVCVLMSGDAYSFQSGAAERWNEALVKNASKLKRFEGLPLIKLQIKPGFYTCFRLPLPEPVRAVLRVAFAQMSAE